MIEKEQCRLLQKFILVDLIVVYFTNYEMLEPREVSVKNWTANRRKRWDEWEGMDGRFYHLIIRC